MCKIMETHFQPFDEGSKTTMCLEGMHVQVRDEVNNSHCSGHKLQKIRKKKLEVHVTRISTGISLDIFFRSLSYLIPL